MDINNFPVKQELKHEVACCITAYMAAIGIDVSEEQQQKFQEEHSEDLIESVLDAIAAWQEQPADKWIKITDRFPKNNERVLIHKRTGHIIIAIFLLKDQWDRVNMFLGNGAYYDLSWITHWTSLPDAENLIKVEK